MFEKAVRFGGAALGFAFGAVWVNAGFGAAMLCLLTAAIGLAAALVAQTRRLPSQQQMAEWITRARGFLQHSSAPTAPREGASSTQTGEARNVATYGWSTSES